MNEQCGGDFVIDEKILEAISLAEDLYLSAMNEQCGGDFVNDEKILEAISLAEDLYLSSQLPRVVAGSSNAFMDFSNSLVTPPKPISSTCSTPRRCDSQKDLQIYRLEKELGRVSKRLLDLEHECSQLREWKNKETQSKSHYPKRCLKFCYDLYELVDDPWTDSIISWSKSNRSFVIRNQEELIHRKMLSRFSCRNLTEFISRLKVYGFKQIKRPFGQLEFCDKNFVRGRPELMERINESCRSAKAKEEVKERFQNLRI